jgi:hypothetical protein
VHRRSALAATTLAAFALAGAAAPSAVAADTPSARVQKAQLLLDGSVKTETAVTCSKGSTYQVQVAISQEFQSNGSYYDAVAYTPAVVGVCTGKAQRLSAQTTTSDRAAFQRSWPTVGTILLTVTTADLSSEYYRLQNAVALR